MSVKEHLKTEHVDLDRVDVVRSPIDVLGGVSDEMRKALEGIDIFSVFDLATSHYFSNARKVTFLEREGGPFLENDLVPSDVLNENPETAQGNDLATRDITELKGIGRATGEAIKEELPVRTIRDLAVWPPYLAAREIVGIDSDRADFVVDPGIPDELVPKLDEYATEKNFYSVYTVEGTSGRGRKELERAIVIEDQIDQRAVDVPRTGKILRYEQSWTPMALTLGNLLHSMTLAPGESTRIAVIDWTRRQGVRTTEEVSQTEALSNSLMQTRSVSEVSRAVAREAQSGFSEMNSNSTVANNAYSTYGLQNAEQVMAAAAGGAAAGGAAGAAGGGIAGGGIGALAGGFAGAGVFSIPGAIGGGLAGGAVGAGGGGLIGATAGGIGAGVAAAEFGAESGSTSTTNVDTVTTTKSTGSREVEAEMLQNIQDRTHQHSSTARNRKAAIVQEITQEESEEISTRVVTNYNHMHALTIQYFEVVQLYSVKTTLIRKENCLYIPFRPIENWNADLIGTFRTQLVQSARSPSFLYSLLTSENTALLSSPSYPRMPLPAADDRMLHQAENRLQHARSVLGMFVSADPLDGWQIPNDYFVTWAWIGIFGRNPFRHDPGELRYNLVFELRTGERVVFEGPDPSDLAQNERKIENISRIVLEVSPEADVDWDWEDLLSETEYHELTFILQSDPEESWEDPNTTDMFDFTAHYAADPSQIKRNRLVVPILEISHSLEESELVRHLDDNTEYYTTEVMKKRNNPLVKRILANHSYGGEALLDIVDPEPVAITDNNLVFQLHDEPGAEVDFRRIPRREGQEPEPHREDSVTKSDVIPVGTGGVFAEAVQGRANAAELLDLTRFWNWQDSPIPIVAPEIAPIQSGSRATEADVRPGSLDQPVVNYVSPNALPAPQGMAGVLSAVSSDLFRDMSGIAHTAQLAESSLEQAMEGATTTGDQASNNLEQGLQFTRELLSRIIEMNSDYAELLTRTGFEALSGAYGGSALAENPSLAGAVYNQSQKEDQEKPGSSTSGSGSDGTPSDGGDSDPESGGSPSGGKADAKSLAEDVLRAVTGIPDGGVSNALFRPGADGGADAGFGSGSGSAGGTAEEATFSVQLGDVTEVDLSQTGLTEFRFEDSSSSDGPAIPEGHDFPATDVGYVARVADWEETLRSDGRFWFVPLGTTETTGGTGTLDLTARSGESETPLRVHIDVTDGYTTAGANEVTVGSDDPTLDTYRQQQRLNYLGFPGEDGRELRVDGDDGPNTEWARGLFCAAVDDTGHSPREAFTSAGAEFINALNAPRWVELADGPGYRINPSSTGGTQTERWATSWAADVLEAAGRAAAGSDRTLGMQGASLEQGGPTVHVTHQAGMDIDIDTPSTNAPGVPFYRTHTIAGRQYVAAADDAGESRIVARQGGQYVAVGFDPDASPPEGAIEHDGDTYEDEQLLGDIADLIVSSPGYDLDAVRDEIESFAGVETESGAGVERILYNDPRTWGVQGVPVTFGVGHGGHFHVDVSAPDEARRSQEL